MVVVMLACVLGCGRANPLLTEIVRTEGDAATRTTIEAGPLTYLERIAESLADHALSIGGIEWCRVTVRKPHVALGGPLAHASVSVERSRA